MKIVAIRGQNLASLEGEFEIDFMSEPLRSAGLFAVTGNTGAGKSTILDTLCLALYNETPRTNKASENVAVFDVLDKTISQGDSRNILRKGTSDGYAEVDFVALDGDTYRSRWSVRRARDRADGKLQAYTMQVVNVTTGVEQQGTKTELLTRVTELTGLTFYQFTRAVLLAQGDFATFLKAHQSEKAELLEKLTGTEIYSRISESIYQKAKEVESEFENLLTRISDVKLLSDEEVEQHTVAKTNLDKELISLQTQQTSIDKSRNWLNQLVEINNSIELANNELTIVEQAKKDSAEKYDYLHKVDTAQAIRDQYVSHISKVNEAKQISGQAIATKKALDEKQILQKQTEESLASEKKQLDELETAYKLQKPEIEKAKQLDTLLETAAKELTYIKKELDTHRAEQEKLVKNQASQKVLQSETQQAIKALSEWQEKNERYKEIAPRIDLITNLLDDASMTHIQQSKVSKSVQSNTELLTKSRENLVVAEKRQEELNLLLPSEILNLRTKLVDGSQCPVCGSIHHPLANEQHGISLEEEALEKAKKDNAELVDNLKKEIENKQTELARLDTLAKNYKEQYTKALDTLTKYLAPISGWQEAFEQDTIKQSLLNAVTIWTDKQTSLDNNVKQLDKLEHGMQVEAKQLDELTPTIARWQTHWQENSTNYEKNKAERVKLLDGKSGQAIEQQFEENIYRLKTDYEAQRKQKELIESTVSQLNGISSQLDISSQNIAKEIETLSATISTWIQGNALNINAELLNELMSISPEWIKKEKNHLQAINDKQLAISTTLKERKTRLETHCQSTEKVDDKLTIAHFDTELQSLKERLEQVTEDKSTADFALRTHNEAKEKTKSFEKERVELETRSEDWQKLNSLLGSADGGKFKREAQGYTLDVLLGYANHHLTELTARYTLQRVGDTLALQVIDNDMFGDARSVHMLSGGESFLISLALALGLSSLSSDRMQIESLFIDEGFGSLDIDTLSQAMDALENLQTQGRKIGVISHVTEMTERIPVRIQVQKDANGGRSSVKVVG